MILNNFKKNTILYYDLNIEDLKKLKKYFIIFCGNLFDVGAQEIILPFKKNYLINKNTNLQLFLNKNL